MNVQPWAMYTPQAYQPYPLAGIPGGFAPGIGGGQLAQQSLISHLLSGLAGLPGQGFGNPFGYSPVSQFGYPQIGHVPGNLAGLLPFHAVSGLIPGVWGGPVAGQFAPQGLLGTPFGPGVGLPGQGIGGLLPFYAAPIVAPGAWSGQPPYIGGQLAQHSLMGHLLSGLAGHAVQPIGGLPPFQATPGMAAVA